METRNKRRSTVALLSVLVGVAYLYLISIDLINTWDEHRNSFLQGYKASARERTDLLPEEPFMLSLKAENTWNYYSDSLMNLKNDRYLPAKLQTVDVLYSYNEQAELRQMLKYRAILFVTVFISLFLLVVVPVYFYKIMGAFYRNNVFESKNVKRLKILGILMLILYMLKTAMDITDYYYKKSLIDLANYKLSIYLSGAEWLFMGLIALLLAQILKRSVEFKEEQELTI